MINSIFNNKFILNHTKGVIQLGASIGEENQYWVKNDINNRIFVEPISDLFPKLVENTKVDNKSIFAFNCAISNYNGKSNFFISKDSYCSSSLLNFSPIAIKYGETLQTSRVIEVPVFTLDFLIEKNNIDINNFNMLYMDVQGNEYYVIEGATGSLKYIDFIFSEVNYVNLHEKSKLFEDFNNLINGLNFKLIDNRILHGSQGAQGEALYFSNNIYNKFLKELKNENN